MYSILMAVALLVAGVAMTGCKNSEKNEPEQPKQVKTYKMSIQVSKGTDDPVNGPRRVLGLDGSTLNATWAAGEQVRVYNETHNEYLDGYLTPSEPGGASTTLTGTLTGYVDAGDKVRLEFLSPSYSSQAGTLAYISANCDYAIAEHIEVESAENGIISTDGTATFVNQQAVVRFRLIHEGDNPLNVTEFVITAGSNTYTVTPASATNVLYVAIPGYIGGMTFTATDGTNNYTHTKAVADLYNGRYYTTEIDMTLVPVTPAGAINGLFSVEAGKQVYFSKGNLQATTTNKGSTWTWSFATNQWDYVGNAAANNSINGNGTVSTNGTVDLFGWSTNATYYGIHNNAQYNGTTYSGSFRDWGTNAISNGGNTANTWRTLTAAEWSYLFNTRTNAANLRTYATVNGVVGLIIMPDGWEASSVALTIRTYYDYSVNIINTTDWAVLEGEGCVFLPTAGIRQGTTMYYIGEATEYWSSTLMDATRAYYVNIETSGINTENFHQYRYAGQSVRLVKDAN